MKIVLNRDDVKRAAEYTQMVAGRFPKSNISRDRIRTPEEIQGHVLMGRLGELAFLRFLEKTGITIQVGREVLPVGMWDIDDVSFRGWSIDVKCTGADGQNLLLQRSKLDYRRMAGELPHYFVVVKLAEECPSLEKCLAGQSEIVLELKGYMDTRKLVTDSAEIFAVQKEQMVPDGKLKVKTSDFVVPFSKLSKDWKFLVDSLQKSKPFTVNDQDADIDSVESLLPAKYSLCLLGNEAEKYASDEGISQLAYWLRQGIKIQLFLPNGSENKRIFQALVDCFKADKSLLNLCCVYEADGPIPSAMVVDGQVSETIFNAWKEAVPAFNIEQYEIEHFPVDKPLIVKAGAGTGKTAVMVDRVLFLLSTESQLKVSEIAMITFTREAAKNMRDRIAAAMMERFRQTGQYRYLEWMEQLGDMQISTIDSFFKTIISQEGLELGYGTGVRIRGMVHEKNNILRDVMTQEFPVHNGIRMLDDIGMADYEYEKLVMRCWEKLDSWGVYLESIETMKFGQGAGTEADTSDKINTYLKEILRSAEYKYRQLRKRTNSLSVNDFKEELDRLSKSTSVKLAGMEFKFLFVDEFQDTDNSQINSLVWLSRILNCQLFVVGDVKQSIYRFRGAEATAFLHLKHELQEKCQRTAVEKSLVKNYRTASNVLNNLNGMFDKWELMTAEPVVPCVTDKNGKLKRGVIECILYHPSYCNTDKDSSLKKETTALLKRLLKEWESKPEEEKKDDSDVICILNRTNAQVQKTALWCQEAGIPVAAVMEGGFYQCRAVQDVAALLRVMLYPDDPRSVFNYLMSSYSGVQPKIDKIKECAGQEEMLLKYLLQVAEENGLQNLLRDSRRKSVFQLLREIIRDYKPQKRFCALRRQELQENYQGTELETQLKIDYKSYQLNLKKLMKIFYNSFRQDFASLLAVYDFLALKQNTERKEDELTAQPDGDYVVSMTVHKSKGLEYDTVILPLTTDSFNFEPENQKKKDNKFKERFDFLISRTNPYCLGWRMMRHGKEYKNSIFVQELEQEKRDNAAEEARILYVALTRVKNQLYYFIPYKPLPETWAKLLSMGEIEDGGRN